jgi:preprotein translocase SecE subunit
MAIVRTTPRETGNGDNSGETPSQGITRNVDRTKSVVNQGGRPQARPSRVPGQMTRPSSPAQQQITQAGAKTFWNDTLVELRRVVWPTKEERAAGTIVTIGMLIFFALFITGLEYLVSHLFQMVHVLPITPTK